MLLTDVCRFARFFFPLDDIDEINKCQEFSSDFWMITIPYKFSSRCEVARSRLLRELRFGQREDLTA